MSTSSARILCTAAVALCLVSGAVEAQGRGNDKVPPGLAKKGGLPPGQAKKIYRADDGVGMLRVIFGEHGYTVVRTANDGESRYVYYRVKNGPIRRVIVVPGPERLTFRNLPDALLREVLARLY
jgi:hypothetical protein